MSVKPTLKNVKYEDYEIGDSAFHAKTVTEADVIIFAGISGDFNPLHVNAEFAKTQQFGKRVVHGCFSSALISAALGVKLFGPGALYISQKVDFRKPVYIGDTLTAVATVKEKFTKKEGKLKFLKVETNVYNQDDALVTEGEALILIM
ncbi:MAG: MaoC family dehydratase [Candidatus Lokiarchaeota archaeon]|nr:MaoC family dehydratase [Candidatus Lokiarchaeota archaeon]